MQMITFVKANSADEIDALCFHENHGNSFENMQSNEFITTSMK